MEKVVETITNERDTELFAQKIANIIIQQNLNCIKLYLSGDLGAGKTTFSKYLLSALGVVETVKSPTYTIIESYQTPKLKIDHVDLYRISENELYDLGFLEDEHHIWLIEWPEKGGNSLPKPDLLLEFLITENLEIKLSLKTDVGQQLLEALRSS